MSVIVWVPKPNPRNLGVAKNARRPKYPFIYTDEAAESGVSRTTPMSGANEQLFMYERSEIDEAEPVPDDLAVRPNGPENLAVACEGTVSLPYSRNILTAERGLPFGQAMHDIMAAMASVHLSAHPW